MSRGRLKWVASFDATGSDVALVGPLSATTVNPFHNGPASSRLVHNNCAECYTYTCTTLTLALHLHLHHAHTWCYSCIHGALHADAAGGHSRFAVRRVRRIKLTFCCAALVEDGEAAGAAGDLLRLLVELVHLVAGCGKSGWGLGVVMRGVCGCNVRV